MRRRARPGKVCPLKGGTPTGRRHLGCVFPWWCESVNLPGERRRRSRFGVLELVPAFVWGDLSPGGRSLRGSRRPPLLRAASLRSPAKRGQVRFRKAATSRRSPKRLRRGDHPATSLRRTTNGGAKLHFATSPSLPHEKGAPASQRMRPLLCGCSGLHGLTVIWTIF